MTEGILEQRCLVHGGQGSGAREEGAKSQIGYPRSQFHGLLVTYERVLLTL